MLAAASASGASPATGAAATSTAAYSSDVTFAASSPVTLNQQVSYRAQQLHNPAGSGLGQPRRGPRGAARRGRRRRVRAGNHPHSHRPVPHPGPGLAPSGTFTPVNLGLRPCYQLNVDTAGYPPGIYILSFTAGTDPATHTAQFTVP